MKLLNGLKVMSFIELVVTIDAQGDLATLHSVEYLITGDEITRTWSKMKKHSEPTDSAFFKSIDLVLGQAPKSWNVVANFHVKDCWKRNGREFQQVFRHPCPPDQILTSKPNCMESCFRNRDTGVVFISQELPMQKPARFDEQDESAL